MKMNGSRGAKVLAAAAALSMVATPALADRGWGGGYQHRDRDDTGAWVVGGIIGIGMIAAIASAASKSKREREAREGGYRGDDYRGDDYRGDDYRRDENRYGGNRGDDYRGSYSGAGRGIDGAVDRCVSEVERGSTRVETVDNATRDANGWRVSGRINGGQSFDCTIDSEGRIRDVNVGS